MALDPGRVHESGAGQGLGCWHQPGVGTAELLPQKYSLNLRVSEVCEDASVASPLKKWLVPAGGWLLPLPSRFLAAGILFPAFVPAQLCPAGSWHRVLGLNSKSQDLGLPGSRIITGVWGGEWGAEDEPAGRAAKLKSLLDFHQLLIKTEMAFCPWVEQQNSAWLIFGASYPYLFHFPGESAGSAQFLQTHEFVL